MLGIALGVMDIVVNEYIMYALYNLNENLWVLKLENFVITKSSSVLFLFNINSPSNNQAILCFSLLDTLVNVAYTFLLFL